MAIGSAWQCSSIGSNAVDGRAIAAIDSFKTLRCLPSKLVHKEHMLTWDDLKNRQWLREPRSHRA